MTPTERQRIEKEAKAYFDKIGRANDGNEMRAYIAGATAEHDKVRNQAIQDCIDSMKENPVGLDAIDEAIIERFEALKTIS